MDYVAPEIIERRTEHYDGQLADIYAMGICLFILLSGEPLYNIDDTQSLCNQMSPVYNEFYIKFMQNPEAELLRRKISLDKQAIELIRNMVLPEP